MSFTGRNIAFSEYAEKNGIIWLPPKTVAKLMQCSIEHVYDLAKSGRISYIQDGRNIRFRPEDLDAYERQFYGTQRRRRRRRYGTVQTEEQ
jgi:excisionase family DNA binding protein